jgi:hypothetical protein
MRKENMTASGMRPADFFSDIGDVNSSGENSSCLIRCDVAVTCSFAKGSYRAIVNDDQWSDQ